MTSPTPRHAGATCQDPWNLITTKNVVKIKSPEIWNRRHAETAPSIGELFWDDVRTCGLRPFIAEEPHPRPRNSPSMPTSGLGPNADHGRTAWPTASKFLPRTLPLTLDLDLAPTTSSLAPFLNNPRSKNTVFHLRRIPSGQRSLSISDVDITSLGGEKEREYMYPEDTTDIALPDRGFPLHLSFSVKNAHGGLIRTRGRPRRLPALEDVHCPTKDDVGRPLPHKGRRGNPFFTWKSRVS